MDTVHDDTGWAALNYGLLSAAETAADIERERREQKDANVARARQRRGTPKVRIKEEVNVKEAQNDEAQSNSQKLINAARELGATDVRGMDEALAVAGYKKSILTAQDVCTRILTIYGLEHRDGDFGEYIIIDAVDTITGEAVRVSTGGAVLLEKLGAVEAAGGFPVIGTIVKVGRYYDIV